MHEFTLTMLPLRLACAATSDRSLLASAEAAGIDMPSSCRNGTCRTCLAKVASGSIRHLIGWPGLSREEIAAGWILPCVAVPLGDVVLEAPAARQRP